MIIDSPANPIVKALRSLATNKGRQEHGKFLVEGVRAIEDGLEAGFWPAICLYNRALLTRAERGQMLLKRLQQASRAEQRQIATEASERALEAASETVHSQGIVAAFPIIEWPTPKPPSDPALALIANDIQDPGNLGTMLRTAEAAGVTGIWLTPRSVDPYNPKVVRAAMGAHFRLPVYPDRDWPAIMEELVGLGISPDRAYAADAESSVSYDQIDWRRPAALVISNEANGLTPGARAFLQSGTLISIPMAGATESLNAAIACAVIVFEAARQRREGRKRE